MSDHRRPCAVTQGDPSGIGPEITLRAWLQRDQAGVPPFFVLTDPNFLRRSAQGLGWSVPIEAVAPELALRFSASAASRASPSPVSALPARPDLATAASTLESIETAVRLVRERLRGRARHQPDRQARALRGRLRASRPHGISRRPGGLAGRAAPHPVMMLWSEALAVVPVTVHMPLRAVREALTTELIVETARIVARDAARPGSASPQPRLAVAGLNPHAGEGGALGQRGRGRSSRRRSRELQAEGIDVERPAIRPTRCSIPRAREATTWRSRMYHDQALIPIKTHRLRRGGQRDARPAIRAHLARPRHGLRHRRDGHRAARQPDRRLAARGPAWERAQPRLRHEPDRRRCRRCARSCAPTASSPRSRSARISCSTST